MPRANRYILPGYIYHLTHRCHDRRFLLKFAKDRNGYRKRLREAVIETQASLLSYNITSNHVHLVLFSDRVDQIARLVQQAAGEFARDYNRRKKRSGAFWEGRYHATIVDSGPYLWECLKYVELNMVRCGVVKHPREWEWSGYQELMGQRRRNLLLDLPKLLEFFGGVDRDTLRSHFDYALDQAIAQDSLKRQERWTRSLAVGSQQFVQAIGPQVRNRQAIESAEEEGAWVLRENHRAVLEPQNEPMSQFNCVDLP